MTNGIITLAHSLRLTIDRWSLNWEFNALKMSELFQTALESFLLYWTQFRTMWAFNSSVCSHFLLVSLIYLFDHHYLVWAMWRHSRNSVTQVIYYFFIFSICLCTIALLNCFTYLTVVLDRNTKKGYIVQDTLNWHCHHTLLPCEWILSIYAW